MLHRAKILSNDHVKSRNGVATHELFMPSLRKIMNFYSVKCTLGILLRQSHNIVISHSYIHYVISIVLLKFIIMKLFL